MNAGTDAERALRAVASEQPLVAAQDAPLGGQAVLEGVMMRGVSTWAVAVRVPAAEQIADGRRMASGEAARGEIRVQSFPLVSALKRHRWLRLPVIRGVVALGESLKIGFAALNISANAQAPDGEQEISRATWAGTVVLGLALAVGLFFVLPVGLTSLFKDALPNALVFVVVEKLVRIAIFLTYLWAISRLAHLQRVFQYHGAEHKTISCYEAGLPLTPENAQRFSRLHPRCGTSFMLIVMIVAVVVFAPLGTPAWYWLFASRVHRHPARRRARVRGHQVVRAQPLQALGARADAAGHEAPAADDARARPRPARGRDRGAGRRARRRAAGRGERRGPDRDGGRRVAADVALTPRCGVKATSLIPRSVRRALSRRGGVPRGVGGVAGWAGGSRNGIDQGGCCGRAWHVRCAAALRARVALTAVCG